MLWPGTHHFFKWATLTQKKENFGCFDPKLECTSSRLICKTKNESTMPGLIRLVNETPNILAKSCVLLFKKMQVLGHYIADPSTWWHVCCHAEATIYK